MKPDHEAAKKWAHDVWGTLKDIALHEVLETDAIDHRNVAACYLAAKAQLEAVRTALGGYKDSDLASLATTLKAQLDKAEKMRDVASCARTDEPNLIAALREAVVALEGLHEYWNRDPNENAMHDACENTIEVADRTLATIAKLLNGRPADFESASEGSSPSSPATTPQSGDGPWPKWYKVAVIGVWRIDGPGKRNANGDTMAPGHLFQLGGQHFFAKEFVAGGFNESERISESEAAQWLEQNGHKDAAAQLRGTIQSRRGASPTLKESS